MAKQLSTGTIVVALVIVAAIVALVGWRVMSPKTLGNTWDREHMRHIRQLQRQYEGQVKQ